MTPGAARDGSDTGFADLALHVDPQTLRESAPEDAPLQSVLAAVEDQLEDSAEDERVLRGELHGQRSVVLRILGRLDEALAAARLSLRYAGNDAAPVTVAGVRLAVVHQLRGEYDVADALHRQTLESAPAGYRSFAHHHAGRSRFEQGDAAGALAHFEAAADLRAGGDPGLVETSGLAIAAARRLDPRSAG